MCLEESKLSHCSCACPLSANAVTLIQEWLSLGGSVGYIMEQMELDKPYFSKHFEGLLTLDSPLLYDVLNRVIV